MVASFPGAQFFGAPGNKAKQMVALIGESIFNIAFH